MQAANRAAPPAAGRPRSRLCSRRTTVRRCGGELRHPGLRADVLYAGFKRLRGLNFRVETVLSLLAKAVSQSGRSGHPRPKRAHERKNAFRAHPAGNSRGVSGDRTRDYSLMISAGLRRVARHTGSAAATNTAAAISATLPRYVAGSRRPTP